MKAYSMDLRERVLNAYLNKEGSMDVIAKRFEVSHFFVKRIIWRYRDTGSIEPKPHGGGHPPAVDQAGQSYIKELLQQKSDLTLAEICQQYQEKFGKKVSISAMDRTLKKMGITRKKKTVYDPRKYRPENQRRTEEYIQKIESTEKDDIIFIDETGTVLNMTPAYARSPKGEPAIGPKPTSPGQRISTVGALSSDGIEAAMSFEGTFNGDLFLLFVSAFLLPILRRGHVVVMDNCSIHKADEIVELIESKGASVIYLPPYSPELNPIELAWSKVKQFLRSVEARTIETLYNAIGDALKSITPSDAEGWIDHSEIYG